MSWYIKHYNTIQSDATVRHRGTPIFLPVNPASMKYLSSLNTPKHMNKRHQRNQTTAELPPSAATTTKDRHLDCLHNTHDNHDQAHWHVVSYALT
jgi:hypothetical protein